MITFGSVCSGIEAASVAWSPIGFKASWLSEIEPFPSQVLSYHYPSVENLGDMTLVSEKIEREEICAPDVLVGGTPCQSFSVAGLRKGLKDDRGALTINFVEMADAIDNVRRRNGNQESIIVWENVPGVLSSKDNAFGCFLGALAGEVSELIPPGGRRWGNSGCVYGPSRAIAWRVLDAQYFGVAQRRRRVFVVASAREGFDPAKVLFEFEGVRRDIAPSREGGREVTADVRAGSKSSGSYGELVGALCARDFKGVGNQYVTEGKLIIENDRTTGFREPTFESYEQDETSSTVMESGHKSFTDLEVSVKGCTPTKLHDYVNAITASYGQGGADLKTKPLVLHGPQENAVYDISGNWIGHKPENGGNAVKSMDNISPCLNATDKHGVSYGLVRRLTPVECERLQGFPDNYTQIPWRNKPAEDCPDGHRYKALGNSMAVPVMRWIGERIKNEINNLGGIKT